MSRLTAAQIVGLGEYLKPDFDPASLTVSQLLGVLGYHNIPYPQPYTKPKLIQTFNDEIKANAKKLMKERLKKENSIASDEGITDGITGEPIGGRKPEPSVRRSSRRLSRAPVESDNAPPRPEPPKRRRSSAQPSLGGSSHRTARAPAVDSLAESEPEEDELPVRKVGRSKKTSQAAGSQARRVSQPMTEDSGWEDNNIFQSGAESSPLRPSPTRPKAARKSGISRKSRKSMSAPPQVQPSPSPTRPRYSNNQDLLHSPPQSNFEPQLPPNVSRQTRIMASRLAQTRESAARKLDNQFGKEEPSDDELNLLSPRKRREEGAIHEPIHTEEEYDAQDMEETVHEQVQTIGDSVVLAGRNVMHHRPPVVLEPTPTSLITRLITYLLAIACFALTINYKLESAPIGYCDSGTDSNHALEVHKAKVAAMGTCIPKNITISQLPEFILDHLAREDHSDCSLSPLVALPHPTSCTPCPEHAKCAQHNVVCDSGYLLKPHPLLFFLPPASSPSTIKLSTSSSPSEVAWKVISQLTDGLPLFGSVALPSRCVEDPRRRRNIGKLGNMTLRRLGQERGMRLCAGESGSNISSEQDGGEAKKWGLQIDELREELRLKAKAKRLEAFNEEFNEAIQELIQWGGVTFSEDSEGKRYLAHKTPELTWKCTLVVNSRQFWREWRTSILGVVMGIIGLYAERLRRAQRYRDRLRAAELVQVALDTLRNQELAHHTDPVTAPQPYLSSLQLRDLILQDEHSIDKRRRIWDLVERVVESNANVRTNLEEVSGGDEMRVWRWVGSTGTSPVKKSILDDDRQQVLE